MFIDARVGTFFLGTILFGASVSAQQAAPGTQLDSGIVQLDVVVTPKSGPPVSGLEQQEFTILDNKEPRTINSFKAVRGREAPVEIILVIDDVNTGLQTVAFERSEIDKFLRMDAGHLPYPTALAFLTDSGMQIQDAFSTDGNALSTALDQYSVGLHSILRSGGIYSAEERFQVSLNALLQLAGHESTRPGRKLILWVSPGWPLLSGPGVEEQIDQKQRQQIFSNVVKFSMLMRQARITLYSIDPLGAADFATRAFYWQAFTKGVSQPYQADWGDIALQVLAVQSGGLALTTGNDVAGSLQKCVADAQAYYEISFVAPADQKRDEYHHLEVRVAKTGVVARTRQGYYSQP
jgi:VWFA-related protein